MAENLQHMVEIHSYYYCCFSFNVEFSVKKIMLNSPILFVKENSIKMEIKVYN
jgi:hypothetical protein